MEDVSRRSVLGFASMFAGSALADAAQKTPAKGATKLEVRSHPLDGIKRENIKITDVKVTLLSAEIPKEKQWYNPLTVVWKSDAVLVQVFTDQGIVGIGEGSPYGGPVEMKKYAEAFVKPIMVGQNPFDVEVLAGTPSSKPVPSRGARGGGATTVAWTNPAMPGSGVWAGVECALWDIIGKAKGLPVYKLLATDNQPEPHVKLYASAGDNWAWYKRPDDLIDEALQLKEQGFTAYKFRLGPDWTRQGLTVQKYIPLLRKLRQAVGPEFNLMQESNMRLSLEQCLELAPVLDELRFLWFEEPVPTSYPESIDNYIRIRQKMPHVMVSGGESRTNRFEFKEWIDRGAYDIVQPDCNQTGMLEAWQIARMAYARKKYCIPHDWHGGLSIMANTQFVAAIPSRLLCEINMTFSHLREGLFTEPLPIKRGYYDAPNKPGFGMELLPDLEKKFPYIPGNFGDRPNPDLPA